MVDGAAKRHARGEGQSVGVHPGPGRDGENHEGRVPGRSAEGGHDGPEADGAADVERHRHDGPAAARGQPEQGPGDGLHVPVVPEKGDDAAAGPVLKVTKQQNGHRDERAHLHKPVPYRDDQNVEGVLRSHETRKGRTRTGRRCAPCCARGDGPRVVNGNTIIEPWLNRSACPSGGATDPSHRPVRVRLRLHDDLLCDRAADELLGPVDRHDE